MEEFILNEQQQYAYEQIAEGQRHILISGVGGSGKSVLIRKLQKDFGHNTVFLSTTGISAINIGGMTMHSGMSIPLGFPTTETLKNLSGRTAKLFRGNAVERIVIDEFSMITTATWDSFCRRLDRFNRANRSRKARNIQVVLLGDLQQLEAVAVGNERKMSLEHYGTDKFYRMEQFNKFNFKLIEFTKVMRQSDKQMKDMLEAIRTARPVNYVNGKPRYNEAVMGALEYFNKRVTPLNQIPTDIPRICPTNRQVTMYNNRAYDNNTKMGGCYTTEVYGNYKLSELPCDEKVYLKIGIGVLILKNSAHDSEVEYSNGDSAVVLHMDAEGVDVRLDRTGEEVKIELTTWEKFGYDTRINEEGEEELHQYVSGSAIGMPLKINAAVSCHRAQGATLEAALVDLGSNCTFTTGLLYVALSRLRSIDGLYLARKLRPEDINVNLDALDWLDELREASGQKQAFKISV